ncbi:MAG: hypothetical protein FWG47_00940 [Propionibacteriaceae bacterium]|nr:hypothetical protein [Propionibacteriaceae bacterium]
MEASIKQLTSVFVMLWDQSFRIWIGVIPRLLMVYVPAWVISRLLEMAAAALGTLVKSVEYDFETGDTFDYETTVVATWNQWAAVVLVALSFLVMLTGIIICWRLISDFLQEISGIVDKHSRSLPATLAITLLPFLSIYSVFDYVDAAANRVLMYGAMLDSDFGSMVFIPLRPSDTTATLTVVGVIVTAFGLRAAAERLAERMRHGAMVFGIIAAILEAFYLFTLFVVGRLLLLRFTRWLAGLQVALWVEDGIEQLSAPLRWLGWSLPDIVSAIGNWFSQVGWPFAITALVEPLLWLALAGLVLAGTQAKSLSQLLGSDSVASRTKPKWLTNAIETVKRQEVMAGEVQHAFFDSFSSKYLPFFQLLVRSLRTGVSFLGAFIIGYALIDFVRDWALYGLRILIGPLPLSQQDFWHEFATLGTDSFFITLRLCYLSAAFMLGFAALTSARESAEHTSLNEKTAEVAK